MLYHVSEESGIERFEPRESSYSSTPIVWGITEARLCNYLLPRECPRVTYYAGPNTTAEDAERFLGASRAVVAIESRWVTQLRNCILYCYHLPVEGFVSWDEVAGYYVSSEVVVPIFVEKVRDAIGELARRGAELRVGPNLWELHDAVAASSLNFSMIRIRNARPRTNTNR